MSQNVSFCLIRTGSRVNGLVLEVQAAPVFGWYQARGGRRRRGRGFHQSTPGRAHEGLPSPEDRTAARRATDNTWPPPSAARPSNPHLSDEWTTLNARPSCELRPRPSTRSQASRPAGLPDDGQELQPSRGREFARL